MADLVFDRPLLYPPENGGGSMWELAADWHIVFNGNVFKIPVGFKTDGASIPRFLWRVWGTPLEAPRIYAALVHDWLYSGGDPDATRGEADAIYRDIQIALGVSRFAAYVEWAALRMFGSSHWLACVVGVLAAAIVSVLAGCIEIAHVDSFVTLPKDVVSFGVQKER